MIGVIECATIRVVVHHVVCDSVRALELVHFLQRAEILPAIARRNATVMRTRIADFDISWAGRIIIHEYEHCALVVPLSVTLDAREPVLLHGLATGACALLVNVCHCPDALATRACPVNTSSHS